MEYNKLVEQLFKIESNSELYSEDEKNIIYETIDKIEAEEPSMFEFLKAIEVYAVIFFLSRIDQVMVYDTDVKMYIDEFRKSFFVKEPIKYDVVMTYAVAIMIKTTESAYLPDKIKAYAKMLIEVIEGQKKYEIFEFI